MGPTRKRTLSRAAKATGSVAALTRLLGVSRQTYYNWRQTGTVPAEMALKIAKATKDAVTAHELRPDLW